MEVERRKKKAPRREMEVDEGQSQNERDRLKKLKGKEGGATSGSGDTVAMPTEEEVDELYAILRRMKEAVNYFDSKGKEWRHALEQAEVTLDGDDREPAVKNSKDKKVIFNDGFDLNAVAPEADDDGGA